MELRFVYIVCESAEQAQRIGKTLVDSRLAACVNILDRMRSMYWWDGAVQSADETVMIAKTRAALVPAVCARVKELHSYEVPCVASLPLLEGNPDFFDWIVSETADPTV
ncbi:MAG: divalent-cation tolerance protein CutA [Deltaproteobacteria bacterium]|nr:divalent-cation tolerance protein CutA [Deltaproteobacteria bacterium]